MCATWHGVSLLLSVALLNHHLEFLILFILTLSTVDPISLVHDNKIKNELSALGISVQSFNGDLLYKPWEVYDENGQAFTTFNMYWDKCMDLPIEILQSLAPVRLVPVPGNFWP